MRVAGAVSPIQCIGANNCPGGCASVICARSIARPCGLRSVTRSAAACGPCCLDGKTGHPQKSARQFYVARGASVAAPLYPTHGRRWCPVRRCQNPAQTALPAPKALHVRGKSRQGLRSQRRVSNPSDDRHLPRWPDRHVRHRGAEHGALAADGAVRIGHRAAFFGPSGCGQQNIGTARGIGLRGDVADDYEIASGNRGRYRIRIRHRHGGVRVDDPDSFDLLICHGAEHIHRLEVRALGQRACVSELLHRCTVVCIFQIEVAREHVRKPTHFAAAHRIRLARY